VGVPWPTAEELQRNRELVVFYETGLTDEAVADLGLANDPNALQAVTLARALAVACGIGLDAVCHLEAPKPERLDRRWFAYFPPTPAAANKQNVHFASFDFENGPVIELYGPITFVPPPRWTAQRVEENVLRCFLPTSFAPSPAAPS
jgi:hypothetical protein